MDTFSYQTWFAVRYVHLVSVTLLIGGALSVSARSGSSAAGLDMPAALVAAVMYERAFWLVAAVTVATGVRILGLTGVCVVGTDTAWGSALALKLTLALVPI